MTIENEIEPQPDDAAEPPDTPAGATTTPTATEAPQPRRRWQWEDLVLIPLILIILLGAYFRFNGLNWDDGTHLHPDERFLTGVATSLQPVTDPLAYLRTSESSLNPYNSGNGFYVYGNFPMTATRYVAEWVNQACATFLDSCTHNYTGYDGIHFVGRALSGLIDLVSVLFIFLIGYRLYDWRAGLLAALLLALAVMPIQQSHFFTMDNWAAGLTTVTMYMAVRAADNARQKRWWLLFGLFLGLTVASRINVAPLAAMAGVAGIAWLARRGEGHPNITYLWTRPGSLDLQVVILGVALAALMSLLTFRLAQPYAFADANIIRQTALEETGQEPSALRTAIGAIVGLNPQWRSNMSEIQGQQSPEASFPPALQWTNRTPILFPLSNMVLYGMGLTAGIMAWVGFLWAVWQIIRTRPGWIAHLLPVAWVGGYFFFMATRWVKSIRYFLPVYPFLLLLAAWALVELWQRAGHNRVKRAAVAGLVALVILPTFLWANAFTEIYRQPFTRVAASRWIYENVPTGATLLYTQDGQPRELQLPLKKFDFQPGGLALTLPINLPDGGTVTGLRFNYLSDYDGIFEDTETLQLALSDPAGQIRAEATLNTNLGSEKEAATVHFEGVTIPAGETYLLTAQAGPGGALVADTSHIVNEHWDDLLPANIDGKSSYGAYYTEVEGGQRPITWPDNNEDKRQAMYAWIDEADYIALSSQRSIWSTPRLPLTYPLNIRYYEALFNGELGFELVNQAHADIHIGPLYISDTGGALGWGALPDIGWPPPNELAAEEAFSVYDHPPVWIFRKTEAYDPAKVRQILGTIDLNEVIVMNPGQATKAPNGLLLSDAAQALQQANGTFRELFNPEGLLNRNPWLAAAVWWLAVVGLGWLTFPLAFVVFRGFPGRGYALARILSLLLISYFGWLLASTGVLPNTRATLLLGVGLLTLLNLLLYLRRRVEINQFVRQNLAYILFVELLGLALFLISLLIRLGNPDVWDIIWGGEKPMDLSYFTAVLKSTTFPPYDPWFAGGYINYYYYGFVYVGALTKLLGIAPTIAYNLIIPMLFSFTGLGAFSVAYNLAAKRTLREEATGLATPRPGGSWHTTLRWRAVGAGLTAVMLCVLLGNLAEVGVLVGSWQRAGESTLNTGIGLIDTTAQTLSGAFNVIIGGQPAPIGTGDWFWTATRAINANPGEVAPITEFPFFTFLYADLHAHMISLPLTLLALAWAVSLVLQTARFTRPGQATLPETALVWLVGGLAIGVLRATNTWDWPTYLFLGCLAAVYYAYAQERQLSMRVLGQAGLLVLLLAGLSTLTFWPYIANYGAGYESFSLWPGSYTHLSNYLAIYGLFLLLVVTHLAREFRDWTRGWTPAGLQKLRPWMWPFILSLILYVFILLILTLKGYWVTPVVLTLTIAAGLLGLRPSLAIERRVVLILISSALGLTALVEFIVLDGDIGRMNTVFKFYLQVWVMLSVASGAALAWAWPAITREWRRPGRRVWQTTFVLLIAAAALYPLLATKAKWETRMSQEAPNTPDGMAFMQYVSYGDTALDGSPQSIPLNYEYEALRWMQANISGSPVIVEAHGGNPYRSITGRVAMYTGLPTIIGWDWHQRQQRAAVPDSLIWNRVADVETLYNTTDINQALRILNKYNVAYVYAGQLEWTYFSPEGMRKFDQMAEQGYLNEVFRNGGVSVYEVVR